MAVTKARVSSTESTSIPSPTQVNRRTVQHKHNKVASLLQANDRMDMTAAERQGVQDSLMREVR